MQNLLRQIVEDWPQVDTDEDMNGADAVDALITYIHRAKTLLSAADQKVTDREACFDHHLNEATHGVIAEFEWLALPNGDQRSALLYEINDALDAIMQKWK